MLFSNVPAFLIKGSAAAAHSLDLSLDQREASSGCNSTQEFQRRDRDGAEWLIRIKDWNKDGP